MGQRIDGNPGKILEHLAHKVPDAVLEYERAAAMHRFVIKRDGLTYSLSFPDWALRAGPLEELKKTIDPAINRIVLGAAPRRIWVGSWQAEESA